MVKIGIIGHFGGMETFVDGQTVKTLSLYNALKKCGYTEIQKADTYYIKRNPSRFLVELVKLLIRSDKIIVLVSDRGRKVLFPLLKMASLYKDIYHYAIGGRIAKEATESDRLRKCMGSFSGNWVESRKEERALRELGLINVRYIPNFKCISPLQKADYSCLQDMPRNFCLFSRITREKGVEDAIRAVRRLNEEADHTVATLDIYGPIETGYEERLQYVISRGGGTVVTSVLFPLTRA